MTNRREFLQTTLGMGAMALAGRAWGGETAPMRPLKVCVFSDIHYCPGVFVNDTTAFLEQILARAEAEKCDMVIHLGDFVHDVSKPYAKAFLKTYNEFKIPTYHCLGNHDQEGTTWRQTCEAYRMRDGHYFFDRGGFRFIVADPNYWRNEETGAYVHYQRYTYGGGKNRTLNWIPPEQLDWLRETIETSPNPCVVLSHQSFERPTNGGGVQNKDAVQAIFNAANAKCPGKVRLVMNGHLHADYLRLLDNILYWDVNSANYVWFEKAHTCYPADYVKAHRLANHNLGWTRPLSAILTLSREGGIKIDGATADWLYGVTPQQAKVPSFDVNGRFFSPTIQSANFRFLYG